MKSSILVLSFFTTLLLTTTAQAVKVPFEGNFAKEIKFYASGYRTAEACASDGGDWEVAEGNDGSCIITTENTVDIVPKNNVLQLTLSLIGYNFRTCDFTSEFYQQVDNDTLLFSAISEEYDQKTDEFKEVLCEVNVDYLIQDEVNVSNNGLCSAFCGAGLSLDVTSAKRK